MAGNLRKFAANLEHIHAIDIIPPTRHSEFCFRNTIRRTGRGSTQNFQLTGNSALPLRHNEMCCQTETCFITVTGIRTVKGFPRCLKLLQSDKY